MHKTEKERVVAELAQRLQETDSLIVADYRGLSNAQLASLRTTLREHGARFSVVKNTLARRAADAAGADALLALLEGPTAIAFVESSGDPAAVAKALAGVADTTNVLTLRGGILSGKTLTEADVVQLSKLPSEEVLKSQLVGVIVAPLTQLAALVAAPLRDLVGVIDARIAQLEEGGDTSASAAAPSDAAEAPAAEAEAGAETSAEAEPVVDQAPGEAEEPAPGAEASAEPPPEAGEADAGEAAETETETNETDSNEEE